MTKLAKRKTNGQAILEFGLTILLVVFILTVFLDLGRAIYYYAALSNSVREGSRYAIVHSMNTQQDLQDIEDVITNTSTALDADKMTIEITPPVKPDTYVVIAATYDFTPVTPGLKQILGGGHGITLQAQSRMQVVPIPHD